MKSTQNVLKFGKFVKLGVVNMNMPILKFLIMCPDCKESLINSKANLPLSSKEDNEFLSRLLFLLCTYEEVIPTSKNKPINSVIKTSSKEKPLRFIVFLILVIS